MKEPEEYKTKLRESMKVPTGYFDQNKVRMLSQARETATYQQPKVVWKKPVLWLSAAAILTLGMFVYFNQPADYSDPYTLYDLPEGSIATYLNNEYVYGLEEPLIAEVWRENSIELNLEEVPEEKILDFLTTSGIDETTLYMDYEN
ncbi:MAG: hypothetical protein RLP14_06265 [Owenweeksia sp.]